MIVNAAIFTCSICGETSTNICSYCTKDACANHRCERCKRCSDCCECEYPLSAEEPAPPEVVTESVLEPETESPEPEVESIMPGFLTLEESSVFVEGSIITESTELTDPPDSTDLSHQNDPTEPCASSTFEDDRK
jgi:hypothetical protein